MNDNFNIMAGIANEEIEIGIEKMYIEITKKCNLRCKHCYNSSGGELKEEIPLEKIIDILYYIKEKGLTSVALSGGEALLHSKIEDILKKTKELELQVMLLTNGTIYNEKIFSMLFKYNPEIQVSIDGPTAQANDEIRGEGSFEKAVFFINELKKNGYKNVININTVINKFNYGQYIEMKELAKNLKVDYLAFSMLSNAGRATETDIKIKSAEKEVSIKVINEKLQMEEDFICKGIGMHHSCSMNQVTDGMIKIQPKISGDGDVFPCQMYNDTLFSLGNIYKQSIKEIVEGEATRRYLLLSQMRCDFISECKTCSVNKICGKGCMAKAVMENNKIFSTDTLCKYHKKNFFRALNKSTV